ncbi:hypothetical protein GGE67_005787 [Rhizobium leucaenae]|nr:hypothetical protein [Rhizobium leucaenae]
MQKLSGGIVDIDEQGAFGAAVLEPTVMRPVDLHQYAKAVAPATRLENPFLAFRREIQMPASVIHSSQCLIETAILSNGLPK